jgi:hypothetical protein
VAKGVTTLILDIDSASVGACLLSTVEDRPLISKVTRLAVGTGELRDPKAMIPQLKEALAKIVPEYAKENPHEVAIILASPWFSASLRTLASKSDKPVRISQSTVTKVVSEYRKTEHDTPGMQSLEAVPITVAVNGYHTHVQKTLAGTTLAVTLYESVADSSLLAMLTDTVHNALPRAHVAIHSSPLVYTETILALTGEENGLVIDVGSEVTDVALLTQNTLGFVGSIPVGARTIERAAAGKGSLADSASRLVMLAKNELGDADMQATAAALTTAGAVWQQGYAKILEEAGNTLPTPRRVFIIGDKDEMLWFPRVVAGAAARPPGTEPVVITPDFFHGGVSFGEGGIFESSLALAVLFVHTRGNAQKRAIPEAAVLYSVQ